MRTFGNQRPPYPFSSEVPGNDPAEISVACAERTASRKNGIVIADSGSLSEVIPSDAQRPKLGRNVQELAHGAAQHSDALGVLEAGRFEDVIHGRGEQQARALQRRIYPQRDHSQQKWQGPPAPGLKPMYFGGVVFRVA